MAKVRFVDESQAVPQHITIVAGPTFGQAMKFVLLGAVLGAGAVAYLSAQSAPAPASLLEPRSEHQGDELGARVGRLAARAKILTQRARALVASASDNIKPVLEHAVAEGKTAAAEYEAQVKSDVQKAGDRPVIAEAEEQV